MIDASTDTAAVRTAATRLVPGVTAAAWRSDLVAVVAGAVLLVAVAWSCSATLVRRRARRSRRPGPFGVRRELRIHPG